MTPKVLMLGWEFPPMINGGLGIACLGMAKALRQHVDLTIILPRTDPSFQVNEVDLVGLNHLEEREVEAVKRFEGWDTVEKIIHVPVALDPYGDAASHQLSEEEIRRAEAGRSEVDCWMESTGLNLFQGRGALYDSDVNARVVAFARAAVAIARERDFDIIHAHDWMTFLAGMEIKRQLKKPLVLHIHSLSYDRAGAEARGWVYDIERQAMHEADRVIPVSRYTGHICRDHYGVPEEKIFAVHNGAEAVEAFRSKKPFPGKLVLFLGRLTGQKGPRFFLEIAAKVLEQTRDVRFVMAGTGDKLRELIEYGAFRDVGDRLHFTGFLNRDEVNHLLSMTDVYCMPSVSEPFGLSALEAAQFEIPAVISRQSGASEVLTEARKADYWDVDLMAKHIVELISDDQLHKEAVAASRQDQENCTWERAAERILPVYQSCLPCDFGLASSPSVAHA